MNAHGRSFGRAPLRAEYESDAQEPEECIGICKVCEEEFLVMDLDEETGFCKRCKELADEEALDDQEAWSAGERQIGEMTI